MARRPRTDLGTDREAGRTGGKSKTGKAASSRTKTASTKTTGAKTARGKSGAAGSGATAAQPGADPRDIRQRLQAALIEQLAGLGWRDLSYAQIVQASGVPLASAYRLYRSKMGVLHGLAGEIDQQVLAGLEADPLDGTARDRLFDLVMRRLDLQAANKAALENLFHALPRSPGEAVCVAGRLRRSMALMLDLAGISTSGLRGLLRIKAMTGLYLHVMRAWLKDDSDDSSATMALLDKRLNQAERLLGLLHRRSNSSN